MIYKLHFEFTFKPLEYLEDPHKTELETKLQDDGSPPYFRLNALQRRNRWIFELPLGTFHHDFTPVAVTHKEEQAKRVRLVESIAKPRQFRLRDIVEQDSVVYYHRIALEVLQHLAASPLMFRAMLAFMDAAERDRTLVKGQPAPRPFVPLEQRQAVYGTVARGPAWTPAEDLVLHRWFGRRAYGEFVGQHVPLTEAQWTIVLAELQNRRTRNSVQQRVSTLNHKLLQTMLEEQRATYGTSNRNFLLKSLVPKYMERVLGERPRFPPMRAS